MVPEPAAGSLVGPLAVIGGLVVLLARLLVGLERGHRTFLGLECLLLTYLAMLAVGAVAYAVVRGDAVAVLLYAARSGLSPYLLLAALLAGVAGVLFTAVVRTREAGADRPRWPWERPGRD